MPDSAPIPVIVNRSGGTAAALGGELETRIQEAFAAAGCTIALRLVDGSDIAEAVAEHADAPLLVAGGGDGTLGTAAQARVSSGGGALGLLPLGTRNHLARELGMPDDLAAAATVIAAGHRRRIDLATVNDVGFVNNASIGLYPLMVRWRDAERGRRGLPKWLATIPAAWAAMRRLPRHRLRLSVDGSAAPIVTALLFVGNNRYTLERGHVGQRIALDDGLLSVFAVAPQSRAGLLWFGVRTLLGFSDPQRDFAAIGESAAFDVASRAGRIDVALDGEVRRLSTPLHFQVHPGAIEVIVPQPDAQPAERVLEKRRGVA